MKELSATSASIIVPESNEADDPDQRLPKDHIDNSI